MKELRVFIVSDDGTAWEAGDGSDNEDEPAQEVEANAELAQLSLRSAAGISSPRTMKMRGSLRGEPVVVLVDSGASHNFIDTRLVTRLNLRTKGNREYGVVMGTGMTVKGIGTCPDLELVIQGYKLRSSFLPLELGNIDIILGMQWLELLGNMRVNWRKQVLEFEFHGQTVKLLGDVSLSNQKISMKSLWKSLGPEDEGLWVECRSLITDTERTSTETVCDVAEILERHITVFSEPTGLPPIRQKEHSIELKPRI